MKPSSRWRASDPEQDDVLYSYMTPKELFIFACQMRTNLNNKEIKVIVTSVSKIKESFWNVTDKLF